MSERQIAVYNQFRNAQDKYTYYLLAAAGAAVAFALRETQSAFLTWTEAPLALAVLCWGFSFYFGCRNLLFTTAALYSNFQLLTVAAGEHALTGRHPEKIAIATNELSKAIERAGSKAERSAKLQFTLLIWGSVLFISWHIWEMWVRTPQTLLK